MRPDSTPAIGEGHREPDAGGPDASVEEPGGHAVILHLTGPHRGTRQHLTGTRAIVGSAPDATVHFPQGADPQVRGRHAVLVRGDDGWSILEAEGQVYVNSADVPGLHGRENLVPGDILEIGSGGPVIRFVMETREPPRYKSIREAWRDTLDCARYGRGGPVRRLGLAVRSLPRELLTRTAPRVRIAIGSAVVVALVAIGAFASYALRVERRLGAEEERSARVEEALGSLAAMTADDPELRDLVRNLQQALTGRIEALEQMSDAGRRVVMAASSSVLFVQGGYRLVEKETGRPLRIRVGPSGAPRIGPGGIPLTTLEGDGPIFEVQFTGSAWLASEDGLLVTNRHVAIPWSENQQIGPIFARGLEPQLRLLAYLPDQPAPVALEFVTASAEADLAIVRAPDLAGRTPLPLAADDAEAGQSVLVLGYPAGIDALLARSGQVFVDSVMRERPDFWTIVRELSDAGYIRPLATRGIIGQVTPSTVAYDAETTRGGSGGPVLSLDGEVVAVTFAILADFGGSNLGVPAREVARLLADAKRIRERDGT